MAQSVTTTARIDALEAAKKRIEALEDGIVLQSVPMAELLGIHWNALRGWCNFPIFEGSGAFIRGGNGIAWEFDPRKTVDTLLAHFRGEISKRQDRNRNFVASMGITMDEREAETIDIGELSKQVSLTLAMQEHKMKQGGYVPVHRVVEFLRAYNQAVVQGVLGVGTKTDPTGNLPATVRATMNDELRSVAVNLQKRCSNFIGEFGAGLIEPGDRGVM
jgi:hypothetical protein